MKIIDGKLLAEMFKGGANLLENNKKYVDSLNVFPVPDGDTGTNMSMTMASAVRELESVDGEDVDDLANAFATGALKGARGNSGVILSQIIKGLAKEFKEVTEITTKIFAKGLTSATEIAYNAVTKPKEGTILTVLRLTAEAAPKLADKNADFTNFMTLLIKKADEVLKQTPEMLPVLKKAGVVDAGGMGLLFVFKGFSYVLEGKPLPETEEDAAEEERGSVSEQTVYAPNVAFTGEIHDYEDIKYAYCTEYFVVNIKNSATEEDIKKLRDKLMQIGDSVIVIGDLSLVKVHVHTNQPNKALMHALQLGEIDKIKIENMLQQAREVLREREANKKDKAIISICAGEGIAGIMRELLVDTVIEGGQTMNPSVDDILSAINRVNSDNIIVLPNNKNIILAAEQARELTKKNVSVLPTKNIPQGIAAAIAFDAELSFGENVENMRAAFDNVKCGQVTYAVRTAKIDGFSVKEGDIIGLDDKKIIAKTPKSEKNPKEETAKKVIDKLVTDENSIITLYYGEGIEEDEAKAFEAEIAATYEELDVVTFYGGQPHYSYLISIE